MIKKQTKEAKLFTGISMYLYSSDQNITYNSFICAVQPSNNICLLPTHFLGVFKCKVWVIDGYGSLWARTESTPSTLEFPSLVLVNKIPISIASILIASNCLRNQVTQFETLGSRIFIFEVLQSSDLLEPNF